MKGKVTLDLGKKLILGAIALLGFTAHSNAQTSLTYNLGVIGGPQITNISTDLGSFSSRVGFNAGIAQELRIGSMFSVELDAIYSAHIADHKMQDSFAEGLSYMQTRDVKTSDQFNYLEGHLLFKLNIPIGSKPIIPYDRPDYQKAWISIYAGPYYSHLMSYVRSGTITVTQTQFDTSIHTKTVITETGDATDAERKGVYTTDIGVTAGIGLNLRMNDHWIFNVDARYSKGFSDIDAGYDGPYNGLPQGYFGTYQPVKYTLAGFDFPAMQYKYATMTHSAIALMIGLKYQFGK
jgi:hypothetical protein